MLVFGGSRKIIDHRNHNKYKAGDSLQRSVLLRISTERRKGFADVKHDSCLFLCAKSIFQQNLKKTLNKCLPRKKFVAIFDRLRQQMYEFCKTDAIDCYYVSFGR